MKGAVLVGGAARRFGGLPKGLCRRPDGRTVVGHLIDLLGARCEEVILIGAPEGPYGHLGLRVVPDRVPGKGPVGGLFTALSEAREGPVCLCACDLPNLDGPTLDALIEALDTHDAALWRAGGYLQPLVGVWDARVRPVLESMLPHDGGFGHLVSALDAVILEAVDEGPFANLNTPAVAAALGLGAPGA